MNSQWMIWIVDDDNYASKLLKHQLCRVGQKVITLWDNPCLAIEQLHVSPNATDMIFLDLQMPDMDGIEFIRQLADLGYSGSLVLSSGQDERMLQAAKRLAEHHLGRAPATLSKPVAIEQLKQVLPEQLKSANTSARHGADEDFSREQLAQALSAGEFVNFYEPKVDFQTGSLTGVEALTRWRRGNGQWVTPVHFIGLLEKYGFIRELTIRVLRQGLAQLSIWKKSGLEIKLAVNISMHDLVQLDFPDQIAREVAAFDLPMSCLNLEVTESQLMENPAMALDILSRLRLKGVGLSIDDFGTGYSSMAQLCDVPFDELKIDQGFARDAMAHPSRRAVVEASVELAHKLGMHCVAEGVEQLQDWIFLRDAGCELAQGYFIAAAMPPEQLLGWHTDWQARLPIGAALGKNCSHG